MKLKKYDGKRVRITCANGEYYDGIAEYFNREYCMHEYGREEECLELVNFIFFKVDIKKIGEFGDRGFPTPYGKIEVENMLGGIDSITDQLFDGEEEHVYRMLLCLEAYPRLKEIEDLDDALSDLLMMEPSERCRKKAEELLKTIRSLA